MSTFRHNAYGRQQGVSQARGQPPSASSSSGFTMPGFGRPRRMPSSLGGAGAMIASGQVDVGSSARQSDYGGRDAFRSSSSVDGRELSATQAAPHEVTASRANQTLSEYLDGVGEQRMITTELHTGASETPVRVTRSFYDLYFRLFESVSEPGEDACNLHSFVRTVEKEDEETLYLVINDPLLVSLAKSQPRKLIKSYPAVPEYVNFHELISRLQRETRLDFSDVHGKRKPHENQSMWDEVQATGREFYRRFLTFSTKDFAEQEHVTSMGRGQKVEGDTLQSLKPHVSTPVASRIIHSVVDLTENDEETKTAPTYGTSLPPLASTGTALSPRPSSFMRPGPHVHDEMSGQGGMGAVQSTRSPEEKYIQATERVDMLMRKRQAAEAAAIAKESAQVVDLVSDDEEENNGMDVQMDEETAAISKGPGALGKASSSFSEFAEGGISPDQLIADRFREITNADSTRVEAVLSGPHDQDVVRDKFNIDMTRAKIVCLRPRTWLNDEVINFYMCMLKERDDALCRKHKGRKSSHFFNSFFISKLLQIDGKEEYDYKGVRRWSKKFDTFALDKVFAPVNISNSHWAMLIIYVQKKEIHYNDSMSGSGSRYLNAARRWVVDEAKDKKGVDLDPSEWKLVSSSRHVPQQENGYDCGVFSIINADFASDNLPFRYTQGHMPYFRRKICNDILKGSLVDYSL